MGARKRSRILTANTRVSGYSCSLLWSSVNQRTASSRWAGEMSVSFNRQQTTRSTKTTSTALFHEASGDVSTDHWIICSFQCFFKACHHTSAYLSFILLWWACYEGLVSLYEWYLLTYSLFFQKYTGAHFPHKALFVTMHLINTIQLWWCFVIPTY